MKTPGFATSDFTCLYSPGNDFTTSTDGTTDDSWVTALKCVSSDNKADRMERHLIKNKPAGLDERKYQTAGKNAWKGPYLPLVKEDPWGRKYLVNIGKGDFTTGTPKAVFVISSGPNGVLETLSDLNAAGTLTPGGDDITARVK